MYFSETPTLRKVLSVTCVLCLAGSMFAGCMKKDDAPPTTTAPSIGLNLTETTAPTTQPTAPTTEPVEINENTGVVLSQLNVRSSPSTSGFEIGVLYAGDRIELERRETLSGYEWGYLKSPMEGWIVMDYVKMDMDSTDATSDNSTPAGNGDVTPPTPTTPPASGSTTEIKGTITGNGLNIRNEPSTDGKVQGTYNKGDSVTILEVKNGWGRTNKGWIKMDYVKTGTSTNTNTNTNTNTSSSNNNTSGNGSTKVILKGIVVAKELNIRSSASTEGNRLGSYTYGNRVEILEKSGSWGRTNKGWISLNYVYQDGTTGSKTGSGTITASQLRIRSGPGTGYDAVGSYNEGDTVTILEQFTYNDVTWGCTNKGWISLEYVEMDGVSVGKDRTGTITGNGLNIRGGPGTGYASVGSLNSGDRVTIYKTTTVDGTTWGNIDKGWISMDYVDLD